MLLLRLDTNRRGLFCELILKNNHLVLKEGREVFLVISDQKNIDRNKLIIKKYGWQSRQIGKLIKQLDSLVKSDFENDLIFMKNRTKEKYNRKLSQNY